MNVKTIVYTQDGSVVAIGISAERVDAQGEVGLIKVVVSDDEFGFYYLGNSDRDSFTITQTDVPSEVEADISIFRFKDGHFDAHY